MTRYGSGTDGMRAWLGHGGPQGALGRVIRETFARQVWPNKGGDSSYVHEVV